MSEEKIFRNSTDPESRIKSEDGFTYALLNVGCNPALETVQQLKFAKMVPDPNNPFIQYIDKKSMGVSFDQVVEMLSHHAMTLARERPSETKEQTNADVERLRQLLAHLKEIRYISILMDAEQGRRAQEFEDRPKIILPDNHINGNTP